MGPFSIILNISEYMCSDLSKNGNSKRPDNRSYREDHNTLYYSHKISKHYLYSLFCPLKNYLNLYN